MKQKRLNGLISGEKGQTLIIVMILMLVSALIIAPMLNHVGSGMKTGKEVYEERMKLFYAADAGVEDALWYLQGESRMEQLDSDWEPDDTTWTLDPSYKVTDGDPVGVKPDDINDDQVEFTISYVWLLGGLDDPTPNLNEQLTVAGYFDTDSTTHYIADFITESADSNVNRIGVWLPYGYQYVDGSVTINGVPIGQSLNDYPVGPIKERMSEILHLVKNPAPPTPHRDGTALLWDYPGTDFGDLSDLMLPPSGSGMTPGEQYPPTIRLAFDFEYPAGVTEPEVFFPWIKIDAGIAWDPGVGFYHINSTATAPPLGAATVGKTASNAVYVSWGTPKYASSGGGTSSSLQGDYIAIGNSLMTECWHRYWSGGGSHGHGSWVIEPGPPCDNDVCTYNCRGKYFNESSATVDGAAVPSDAVIKKAFLYWTAWWWTDGADEYATLAVNGDLITPTNGDGLSGTEDDNPGGVFRDRYYVLPDALRLGYQYTCFADVTAEVTAETTDVNGTEFTVGGVDAIPADTCVGGGYQELTNAGWSVVIIYSSAEEEGHQIYLYDKLAYVSTGRSAEFTILGFETPDEDRDVKLTVFATEGDEWRSPDYTMLKGEDYSTFSYLGDSNSSDPNYWKNVFNGYSSATGFAPEELDGQGTGEISGVDIDTYTKTMSGALLSTIVGAGDTSAKIKMTSNWGSPGFDMFMLNYVIFSVRSNLVSGGEDFEVGTMSYEIN